MTDFLDCKGCGALGEHTRKAGCIIATERAAAANAGGITANAFALDAALASLRRQRTSGNAQIYGQEVDWSETNDGHLTIYDMAPELIPADQVARVIYELRQDVTRLNSEAIDYFQRLQKVRTFTDEQLKGH